MGAIFKTTIYVCDHVEVIFPSGFTWPGEVRSVFTNLKGETRLVVECISGVADVSGSMRICAPEEVRVLLGHEFIDSLKRLESLI